MDKLKPCPFCGPDGKPYIDHVGAITAGGRVVCEECGCAGPARYSGRGQEAANAAAVEEWNTRAENPNG